MHFYEASIITTKDGLHCQVYGNEHPINSIIVKPKYIPTDKIECDALPYRFISGKRMNRLNMWIKDKEKLKKYIEDFKKAYPDYILKDGNLTENNLVFSVPIDSIERIYFPRRGFAELMKIDLSQLDSHLRLVKELGEFLLGSGLEEKDIGVTYSSLMGHYFSGISDMNFVIYGKENFWKLMKYLEGAKHEKLRWKSDNEWIEFYKRRNRFNFFDENSFLKSMKRKKSEGFFGDSLFVIFCAEKESERWFKWGQEKYVPRGKIKIKAKVTDNFSSVVRPGFYKINDIEVIEGPKNIDVKKVVFYSRDYCSLALPGEEIEVCGLLEEVKPKNGESNSRIVIGYFDSYLDERREQEYIKPVFSEKENNILKNKFSGEDCGFCKESKKFDDDLDYGAKIIYRIGDSDEGWFATLSPKTGGDPEKDFSIQLIPNKHLRFFSEISESEELSKNYGVAFAKLSKAISEILKEEGNTEVLPICTYGKCKHPDEHIHIKLFPYRNNVGQPFTVDSSFARKEIYKEETGEEFVKMSPVRKLDLSKERFNYLSNKLISLLK